MSDHDDVKSINLRGSRARAIAHAIQETKKDLSRQFRDEALIEHSVQSLGLRRGWSP
jgi:hypothetical protein